MIMLILSDLLSPWLADGFAEGDTVVVVVVEERDFLSIEVLDCRLVIIEPANQWSEAYYRESADGDECRHQG